MFSPIRIDRKLCTGQVEHDKRKMKIPEVGRYRAILQGGLVNFLNGGVVCPVGSMVVWRCDDCSRRNGNLRIPRFDSGSFSHWISELSETRV